MLYIIILSSFQGKCKKRESTEPTDSEAESEPIYEEARERATDEAIEMRPNIVYGKHELQEQTQAQITISN